MKLLDTCILIDVLRGRDAAAAFVSGLNAAPSISAITATELIAGARGVKETRTIDRILETYVIVDINLEIARLAGEYVRVFGPSHAVDPIDALIAATAKTSQLDLATLNIEHFPMLRGLKRAYAAQASPWRVNRNRRRAAAFGAGVAKRLKGPPQQCWRATASPIRNGAHKQAPP